MGQSFANSTILTLLHDNPMLYASIVMSILMSITLHELAHGWAAIYHGDNTPIHSRHMTFNPFVHMGPVSIVCAFVFGMAWGLMPVDPTRMRGKYADTVVSLAGPAMNVLIAFLALNGIVVLFKVTGNRELSQIGHNLLTFLLTLSELNIVLAIFNMFPVPPLDGSRVMSNLNPAYRNFMDNHPEVQMYGLMVAFIVFTSLERTPYGLSRLAEIVIGAYLRLFN